MIDTPSTISPSPALPRALFLVQRDEYGEFIRYAADLAKAWRSVTTPTIWLESGTPATDFGTIHTETVTRFGPFGSTKLARKIAALNPQILVAVGARAGWLGARAAQRAGVDKIAYAALSDLIYTDHSILRIVRNYVVLRSILRRANRLIVQAYGNRYQFLLRKWVSEEKIYFLPSPFDPQERPSDTRIEELKRRDALPASPCRIVYAGPFSERARLDWLLRAWALVEASRANAHLTIVGNGPCEHALRRQAAALHLKQCEIIGPARPLIEYIAVADLVAMTSLYEIHARLPLMAMGCGKPVVAMAVDGVRVSVRDGKEAILTTVGDVSGFAAALLELIEDPKRRAALSEAGRTRIVHLGPDAFRANALQLLAALTNAEGDA